MAYDYSDRIVETWDWAAQCALWRERAYLAFGEKLRVIPAELSHHDGTTRHRNLPRQVHALLPHRRGRVGLVR